ncbi:amidase [Nitratireductor soli]|uniref:amidase n=1 Tax=Nitratireductor soli TaxID=1670619 RepID=UPI00065E575D|nr:amidase [Nitratireductor soli]
MTTKGDDLHYRELTEVAALIRARDISSLDVTRAQLERIASLDSTLHSYTLVMTDAALAQAEAADVDIAEGRCHGPLHGVPIAVKDLCRIKGFATGAGMAFHRDGVATEDATIVRRLKEAGAVLLGKLQLSEGAYSDHHPSATPPRNPWNGDYWTGISSSGSGVATAAGLCYGAIASDTGGSIRWPSAANGLTGLKPTWGRVSRHGVCELAASLDHVGVMTRSAKDAGAMLGVIAGSDPGDPTALRDPVPNYLMSIKGGARGLRIGIDVAWNSDGVDPATHAVLDGALATFRELGAEIVEVTFPDVAQTVADWTTNCAVEAAVAHKSTYPAQKEHYGSVLASVIEAGHAVSGTQYQEILLRRMVFRGHVEALFGSIDLLLTPVQPFATPTLETIRTLGEQPELIAMLQRYTCPFDMSGHPTITLPGGFTSGCMPIGFQLAAAHLGETSLLRAGAAFQSVSNWHRHHPVA